MWMGSLRVNVLVNHIIIEYLSREIAHLVYKLRICCITQLTLNKFFHVTIDPLKVQCHRWSRLTPSPDLLSVGHYCSQRPR